MLLHPHHLLTSPRHAHSRVGGGPGDNAFTARAGRFDRLSIPGGFVGRGGKTLRRGLYRVGAGRGLCVQRDPSMSKPRWKVDPFSYKRAVAYCRDWCSPKEGTVTVAKETAQGPAEVDTDTDRHPTFVQGLRRILQESTIPDVQLESIEIYFLASGEVTYRYRSPRAEETEVGYLPPA